MDDAMAPALLTAVTQRPGLRRSAAIDAARCLAWDGGACQICYLRCPLRDEAIVLEDGRPVVIASACNGCGVCVDACRAVNDLGAIRFVLRPVSYEQIKLSEGR